MRVAAQIGRSHWDMQGVGASKGAEDPCLALVEADSMTKEEGWFPGGGGV